VSRDAARRGPSRAWWRSVAARWAAVAALFTGLLTRIPGFDVLSFHLAIALSPLLAMATGSLAVTAALEARSRGADWWWAAWRAAGQGALIAAIPLAIALASALFAGPCDLPQGLLFFLVWPLASAVTALPVGLWCGMAGRTPRWGSALWVGVFVFSFLPAAVDLYREPPIFFHAPFLGRYPGAFYDIALEVTPGDLAYRLACLLFATALLLAGGALWAGGRRRRWLAAIAASVLGASLGLGSQGAHWGFRVTGADLERVLGSQQELDRCRLRHDGSLDPAVAEGLLRDCLYHLRKAEAFLDLPPGPPVTFYWYRDDDQKARWLGARRVEIAKPWQDAVHLADAVPLDPVIGHEIAHVVAGRLASNPLRVPLRLGLFPDMARVEGLAEAIAFADDGPSLHEWARAMLLAGVPVNLQALFGPWSFLSAAPSRAYTLAGSFLAFLGERHGVHALQAIARGESFERATGQSLESLEAQWRGFLDEATPAVDRLLLDRAGGRFGGPGVLGSRCAVDVARMQQRAGEAMARGDWDHAEACLRKALRQDPGAAGILRVLSRLRAVRGDLAGARSLLESGDAPAAPTRLLAIADLSAMEDSADPSPSPRETWWMLALGLPPHAAESRALAARSHALDLPPGARRGVLGLLAGLPDPEPDLARALGEAPDDGLVRWLAGRWALGHGFFPEALDHLLCAGALGLPAPLVAGDPDPFQAEYLKTLGIAALGAGQTALARRALGEALFLLPYEGERLFVEDLLARLASPGDSTRERPSTIPGL